jgi:hypothetical protein
MVSSVFFRGLETIPLESINAQRGPRRDLWVVVITA